jgi:hypothetical protein
MAGKIPDQLDPSKERRPAFPPGASHATTNPPGARVPPLDGIGDTTGQPKSVSIIGDGEVIDFPDTQVALAARVSAVPCCPL